MKDRACPWTRAAHRRGQELATLARFTRDLPRFLARPLDLDRAARIVGRRLKQREARFLATAERAIHGYPRSPYLRLLRAAGCELGELRTLVGREGLEGALAVLERAGVYVTFDELKGRAEAVRGSARFRFAAEQFDNPLAARHLGLLTGGTRGASVRVGRGLPWIAEIALHTGLALRAHGVHRPEHAVWMIAPAPQMLVPAKLGQPVAAWFCPLAALPARTRLGFAFLAGLSRLAGQPLPGPRFATLDDAARVVGWLDARLRRGRQICMVTYVSSAVRLAVAAHEGDVSLAGLTFMTGGEPITPARRRAIERAGARVLGTYVFTEAGRAAYGCAAPLAADDVHVATDRFAVGTRERAVGNGMGTVDAIVFTTLHPEAPVVLLNAEPGDYGVLERRACGCGLGGLGWRTHLREIRSFEKLTGEGMTFATTDLAHILEDVLPARFGGTSLDYQLVEVEGEHGILRMVLLASPSIGAVDEGRLKAALLEELRRDGQLERWGAELWHSAGTIEVHRRPPIATGAGKVFPFQLIRAEQVAEP